MKVKSKEVKKTRINLILTEEEAGIVLALFGAMSLLVGPPEVMSFAGVAYDRLSNALPISKRKGYTINDSSPLVFSSYDEEA